MKSVADRSPIRAVGMVRTIRGRLEELLRCLMEGGELGRTRHPAFALPRPRDLEVTFTQGFQDIVHELRAHIVRARQ